jgi:predicted Zn-dependent peptidase
MTYQITTLPSGLRVASESLPGVESAAISLSVGVGARYESEKENGISHLLEHMAFKGTKTRSARDIAEAFDNIGGHFNAYTSMELTVYYAKVLKDNIEVAADIIGDILQNSMFDNDELAREQDVVIQEIAMHRDTPDDLINDYFDEQAFPNQPLGRSILASEERVQSHTREDLIRYMDTHYKPTRMVLSASGNITHEKLVALAEKYFVWRKSPAPPTYETAHYAGGDARVKRDLEQLHILFGLPTISNRSPDYYTLQIYTNILGGGMSSRLFQEVREKRGLAYTVYAMGSSYEDTGVMNIYAATSPDKGGELTATLCDEVVAMAQNVTKEELQRAKNQVKAELLMSRENPQTIASWIGRHLLTFNEYRQVDYIMKKIDAVTIEDVLRLGNDIVKGKLTIASLGDVSKVLSYEDLQDRLVAKKLAA